MPHLWESSSTTTGWPLGDILRVLAGLSLILMILTGLTVWALLSRRKEDSAEWGDTPPCCWNLGDVFAVFTLGGILAVMMVVPEVLTSQLHAPGVDPFPPASLARMIIVQDFALFITCYLWLRVRRQVSASDLGIVADNLSPNVVTGIKAGVFLWILGEMVQWASNLMMKWIVGAAMYQRLTSMDTVTTLLRKMMPLLTPAAAITLIVLIGFYAPSVEELLFRGFAYPAMKQRWGLKAGLILSGVFFAAMHFSLLDFPVLCTIGVFLAWLYEETGSLAAPFVAHATNNALTVIILLLFPKSFL